MKNLLFSLALIVLNAQHSLVLQSDFGVKDGAVAAMKGVAVSVSPLLPIFDLSHEIPAFNTWEAAYRLEQTAKYWPPGTVFVSVVDPGVGTDRKSVVLKTKSGHFFVSPDNGTLTLVAKSLGIDSIREIDEAVNRLKNSEQSYTFHGRDVYAYTGARLASGVIKFSEVGKLLEATVISIDLKKATIENGVLKGNIVILDVQYGNIWTNIDRKLFSQFSVQIGQKIRVQISNNGRTVFDKEIPYQHTFASVAIKDPLIYVNSLNNVAIGLNQGNFASRYQIESGPAWEITFTR